MGAGSDALGRLDRVATWRNWVRFAGIDGLAGCSDSFTFLGSRPGLETLRDRISNRRKLYQVQDIRLKIGFVR
jgi:hypothetical protein